VFLDLPTTGKLGHTPRPHQRNTKLTQGHLCCCPLCAQLLAEDYNNFEPID